MPLPPAAQTIADRADNEIGSRLADAVAMQESYLATNGRYWQGMPTQDNPPTDGNPGNPDYSRRPTYQPEDWVASGAKNVMPDPPNTRVTVDVYDGPLGKGWVLRMDFVRDGVQYTKAVNVGPEEYRSHDWEAAE